MKRDAGSVDWLHALCLAFKWAVGALVLKYYGGGALHRAGFSARPAHQSLGKPIRVILTSRPYKSSSANLSLAQLSLTPALSSYILSECRQSKTFRTGWNKEINPHMWIKASAKESIMVINGVDWHLQNIYNIYHNNSPTLKRQLCHIFFFLWLNKQQQKNSTNHHPPPPRPQIQATAPVRSPYCAFVVCRKPAPCLRSHFLKFLLLLLYIFICVPVLDGQLRRPPVAALQLRSAPFLSARRLSSPCPTSRLAGTVVVDGPCRRPLHLAGLIGREKFLRPDRMSKGLCLSRLRAANN